MIGIVCAPDAEALLREMIGEYERISEPDAGFYLSFEDDLLQLRRVTDRQGVFVSEREIDRRLSGEFLLGRACGLPVTGLRVLDAMGGLGVDAMALSRRGAVVDIVEREPMLWALLKDLVRRIGTAGVTATLADCRAVLAAEPVYDVVYLDPMFPGRRKKALPGKRMQYLAALLSQSAQPPVPFEADLIALAQSAARSRVVLKRRLKDPVVRTPDWSLKGHTVRYDIYRGVARG